MWGLKKQKKSCTRCRGERSIEESSCFFGPPIFLWLKNNKAFKTAKSAFKKSEPRSNSLHIIKKSWSFNKQVFYNP